MKINTLGLDLIKSFEKFMPTPYLDAVNVPTIGYGSTFYEDGTKVTLLDKPITEERATELMLFELDKISKFISKVVKVPLTDNQFAALSSFTYNLGVGNLQSSTLLRLLNLGRYTEVPYQFTLWNKAGGKILKGLVRRRAAEVALWGSQ